MIKQRITNVLAPFASQAYQAKYILNGTANQYILPNDLMEDVNSLYILVECSPNLLDEFTDYERQIITSVLESIKNGVRDVPGNLDNQALVNEDPVWRSICEQSKFSLSLLGINLKLWEQINL